MADILDVLNALTALAQEAVYPDGLDQPSVGGIPVRIYPGWPNPATLDADLGATANPKYAHVNIYSSNIARVTTRFDAQWQTVSVSDPTISMTLSGDTVIINGSPSTPQAAMIIVNGIGYSYGLLPGDTLNSIATSLAALIPSATSMGNVITIGNNPRSIIPRVITSGISARELAREKRLVIVFVWAPTPLIRSQIAYAIQVLFAATYRVPLPDGYYGQLTYSGSNERDDLEKPLVFRRDVHFIFEFPTTQLQTTATIGQNTVNVTDYQGNEIINKPSEFDLFGGDPLLLL